jgi:phage FluMu protein Com
MFSQGYIGVSNNVKKRWYGHKLKPQNGHFSNAVNKYGWDNLVKKVILIGEEKYCLDVELKLRPEKKIGWNLVAGGGKPPSSLGRKFGPMSAETKAKVSAAKKGFKHTPENEATATNNLLVHGVKTRFLKGQVPWNKDGKMPQHVTDAVIKANTGRIHSEEEKQKRAKSLIGHRVSEFTVERMRKLGRISGKLNKGRKHIKVKCPHCDKIGGITAMPRWHFDRCKFKEIQ